MKYLTENEEKLLLRTIQGRKGKKAERDSTILSLGFNTGLRCSEIIGLNVGDIRGRDRLHVRAEIAKRAKERDIPLNKRTQAIFRNFIKMKLKWREGIQDEAPLFISKKKGRLSKRSLEELFEFWCIEAALTRSVQGKEKPFYTVHSMRHTFAKRLLQRGADITVIQKLLGHSSLASTGIYTEAGIEEMEEAVNAL
jgi:integrase/recombinase XerC